MESHGVARAFAKGLRCSAPATGRAEQAGRQNAFGFKSDDDTNGFRTDTRAEGCGSVRVNDLLTITPKGNGCDNGSRIKTLAGRGLRIIRQALCRIDGA